MKILFIGGTGVISSACTELALKQGHELFLLNRGQSNPTLPSGPTQLVGDIRNAESVSELLDGLQFDVVVDWIAFEPTHIETDLSLFRDKTGQYIFISSASAYQTPPRRWPITESTPLSNPVWPYSQAKIACENRLMQAYRDEGFPVTIIRPSHTYNHTKIPLSGGYTAVHRMRQGKKVIVHGDGTSLWTLTHHQDFARAFMGVFGNYHAIGDAIHITSDEVFTWNQIYEIVAQAANTTAQIVHIPSDLIMAFDPDWGLGLLGDKAHCMVFDNHKIKQLVPDFTAKIPFVQGAKEIMAWFDADPSRQVVDNKLDLRMDQILDAYDSLLSQPI